MDEHNIDTAALMGHSMGGKTSMAAALLYPDRVKALIVVDICPVDYKSLNADSVQVLDAMTSLDLASLSSRRDADEILKPKIRSDMLRGFLLQNLIMPTTAAHKQTPHWRVDIGGLNNGGMHLLAQWPIEPSRTFAGPTLFVAGANSNYIKEARHFQAIRQHFPRADAVTIEDSGHWIHAENPAKFFQVVYKFILHHMK